MNTLTHSLITARQQAIFDFIQDRIVQAHMPPTRAEICAAFGFASTRAAQKHLEALAEKGMLSLQAGASRGIRLPTAHPPVQNKTKARTNMLSLAILGRVAAGQPIGPGLGEDEPILIDPALFKPTPDYLLRVRGNSMRDEGIFDQDLVAIKQSSTAVHNRIVVARVDDAVTIKKLHLQNGQIWLMPRNPEFKPLHITERMDFSIEGIYCGLIRRTR
jgi:repressor LexA